MVIRKSRGGKVLDEILGKDYPGPVIEDRWRAYSKIDILQRCWAHLIREVDDFEKVSENGKRLSGEIHACFKALKMFIDKDPPMDERISQKAIFEAEIEDIVQRFD